MAIIRARKAETDSATTCPVTACTKVPAEGGGCKRRVPTHCHTLKDVLNYMVESQAGRECTCEYSSGVETVAAIQALAATLFRLQINTHSLR